MSWWFHTEQQPERLCRHIAVFRQVSRHRRQRVARKHSNMTTPTITHTDIATRGTAIMPPHDHEAQSFTLARKHPIALEQAACNASIDDLNQLLADTMTLRDMYKKHQWQVSGPTFYPLHLLFDKHFARQLELVDQIAERVQILGGIALAMAHDVAESTPPTSGL